MRTLKQSTAYELMVFMADSADHVTGKTGLTLTITASKAGAAFASISPTVTERGSGWYALSLTTSHTDTLGDLALHITSTGADPADLAMQVRANVLGDTLPAAVQSVAAGALTAAAFAAGAFDAVWSVATRILTAGTNIALAKGTGVTGFNDLDAAGVRSAVGLATANLDTQLGAIDDAVDAETAAILAAVDTEVAAIKAKTDLIPADPATETTLATLATQASVNTIKAKTDNLPASPAATGDIPTAAQNADALLDRADGVETSLTLRQALRLVVTAAAGKLSGAATTTVTIRNFGDTKDRITATVDADGNRTAVTTDLT